MEERIRLVTSNAVPSVEEKVETTPNTSGSYFLSLLRLIDRIGPVLGVDYLERDDDASSIGVKQFLIISILSVLLWLLSFVIIMTEVIFYDRFTMYDWPMFLPMWSGSLLGIVGFISIIWRLYGSATLVSRERRLYMIAQGIVDREVYIDYESLPLMRMLMVWLFAGLLSLVTAIIAQLLYFLWFNDIIGSIFDVYIPVGITCVLFMIYMFIMNIFSYQACFVYCLIVLQVILFSEKLEDRHGDIVWFYATIPLYISSLFFFANFLGIWYRFAISKDILLQCHQLISLILYSMALVFMNLASVYTSIMNLESMQNKAWNPDYVYILWTIGIIISVFAAGLVLRYEGIKVAHNRGCRDPLVLCETERGWEPVKNGNPFWTWTLGEIHPASSKSQLGTLYPQRNPNSLKSYGTDIELSHI